MAVIDGFFIARLLKKQANKFKLMACLYEEVPNNEATKRIADWMIGLKRQ
jgi:hypothetical protein